jgi:hypothetical protein
MPMLDAARMTEVPAGADTLKPSISKLTMSVDELIGVP